MNKLTKVLLFLFLSVRFAFPGDCTFKRWENYFRTDWKLTRKEINTDHLLYTGAGLIVLYGLSRYDDTLVKNMRDAYKGRFRNYLDLANELGNGWYVIPGTILVTGTSLLTGDEKFQDAAFTSMQSVLITDIIVGIIKFSAGRSRPETRTGVYDFKPFSGSVSFPSGHASTAFAFITPWILYYPGPLTYALFVLPAGTALARMSKEKHWATDVLAGSFIGFFVSYMLKKWHIRTSQDTGQGTTKIQFNLVL